MGTEDEDIAPLVEARLAALGLARTEGLPLGETISPRTLALLRTEQAGERTRPAPSDSSDSVDVELSAGELPRISIDERAIVAPFAAREQSSDRNAADYALVSTIGEGGMGRVYLARQRSLSRDVALKTLKPSANPAIAGSLLREARITGALEHPGVIPIHVLGRNDANEPLLVMKRVNGLDLGVLLANDTHPAWKARGRSDDRLVAMLEILTQVFFTVEFAHSRGIIHRDIKPENIMVGSFGEVYLLDWGIAIPLSEASSPDLVGTPVYMAPEMARGQPVDERSDVYLLGATLHEMLTRRVRHEGATIQAVLAAAMASRPVEYSESVPEELALICNRATARDPSRRHASVQELREDISDFLRHRSARSLAEAAFERLLELEDILTGAGEGPPRELARAYRLATEARFGFTQSLTGHADETASSGMRRCIALSIDLELRQGHADSAEALLREMEPPDPDLEKRIEETRTRDAATAREHKRLEALDHHHDPTQQWKRRSIWVAVFGMGLVVISVLVAYFGLTPTPEGIMIASCIATAVIALGIFVARRRVLTNAFNQRLAALTLLIMLTVVAHRLLGVLTGAPVAETVVTDELIQLAMITVAALTMLPRLAFSAVPLGAAVVVTYFWPRYAVPLYTSMSGAAILVAGFVLTRTAARAKDGQRSR